MSHFIHDFAECHYADQLMIQQTSLKKDQYVMLSISVLCDYAECNYAEFIHFHFIHCFAECHYGDQMNDPTN